MSPPLFSTHDRAFIVGIVSAPSDVAPRLVYADWLDEQDTDLTHTAAAFLRLLAELTQTTNTASRFDVIKAELRRLELDLPNRWLAALDVPLIEECASTFQFVCPLEWEKLRFTKDTHVRLCDQCHKEVHYCHELADAATAAEHGHCVALGTWLLRKNGDMNAELERRRLPQPPMMTMGVLRRPGED